jgi:putative phage-type endonuclease
MKKHIQFELSNNVKPLIDITDIIEFSPAFTLDEYDELIETSTHLIFEHISSNALDMSQPKFYDNVYEEVFELLIHQLMATHNYNIEDELHQILNQAFHIIHTTVVPRRSYRQSFIRKNINKSNILTKIQHIKSKPQPDQRTSQWYEFRYNSLTASSAWKAFGSQSVINQLIYEKCRPLDISKYSRFNTSSPLHHGQKYEPVSVAYYESKYRLKVDEFGCIQHDKYSFIAASPDGIVVTEENQRFGRMLEIKNIVNRKITGIPKEEYWIQMQLQMETCNLNECDFLETRFCEYETKEEFDKDGTFNTSSDGKPKGIIMYYIIDNFPYYEYAPYMCSEEEFHKWELEMMEKHKEHTWNHNIYWKMDEVSCVLVLRNKLWFKEAIKVLENVWQTILYERENGYEHRAPSTRVKSKQANLFCNENKSFDNIILLDANNNHMESIEENKEKEVEEVSLESEDSVGKKTDAPKKKKRRKKIQL